MWNLGHRATPGGVRGVTWRNERMPRRVDWGCHPRRRVWGNRFAKMLWVYFGWGCTCIYDIDVELVLVVRLKFQSVKSTGKPFGSKPCEAFGLPYKQSGRPFGVRFIPIPTLRFMSSTGKTCKNKSIVLLVRLWVPRLITSSSNRRCVVGFVWLNDN